VQPTGGPRPDLQAFFWLRAFSVLEVLSRPAHQRLTQTVETVEKPTFQKKISERWGETIKNQPVLWVSSQILAVFKPKVEDFFKDFLRKGFFDGFVRSANKRSTNRKENQRTDASGKWQNVVNKKLSVF
jgi:hypothetical protein